MEDVPPIVPRVLLDVPACLQEAEHLCGPAALQAVLAWHGIPATQAALATRLGTTPGRGTPLRAVARVAGELGLEAALETLSPAGVRGWIDRGAPCVLLLQAWAAVPGRSYRDDYEDGHHVVAVGYTDEGLVFRDPQVLEHTFLGDADLEERWHSNGSSPTCLRSAGVPIARGARVRALPAIRPMG